MRPRVKTYFAIGILAAWLLTENFFLLYHRAKKDPRHFPNTLEIGYLNVVRPHTKADPIVGFKPSPLGHAQVTTKKDGKVINVAEYSADMYGRRVVPGLANKLDKAALFFGCSFTFGSGVNDNETLPFYFYKNAKDTRAYNYAYFGYGPQQTYARLKNTDVRSEIPEAKAIGIFTFIDDHVHRAIGSMQTHNMKQIYGMEMPLYQLTRTGGLETKGSYLSARPFTALLYRALGMSEILYHFNFNLPTRLGDEDFLLTEKLLAGSRNEFQRQFPGGEFYVLFYPGSTFAPKLKPLLAADHVPVLDYSDWQSWTNNSDMWIPDYGHPTPAAYQKIAKRLLLDLAAKSLSAKPSGG